MDFKSLSTRPLKIFSLPPEILSSLYKPELFSEEKIIVEEAATEVYNEPIKPTCLACGIVSFDNFEQQRAHFKLDWHRFNVKRRVMSLNFGRTQYTPISVQEFEDLMSDSISSISGSETECSDDDVSTLADDLQSVNINKEDLPNKGIRKLSKPILWFTCPNVLQDDIHLGVYKHILNDRGNDPSTVVEDIKRLQIKSGKNIKNQPRYWTMLMVGGGHFAGLILDITQNVNVTNIKEVKVHVYKTFHRYTTRRKQGGSQASNDNSKGKSKSAGADLRRYNEAALQRDVRELLDQWKPLINQSELVFVHAPSINKKIIIHYEGAVLQKDDPRIRSFPFSTRRATFNELKRCFMEFITVKVSQISKEVKIHKEQFESVEQSIKDKPPLNELSETVAHIIPETKTSELIESPSDKEIKLITLTKLGKIDLFKNHISNYSINVLNPISNIVTTEIDINKTPTLLHLASFLGHYSIVEYLLEQGADPTFISTKKMTPYDLAKDKEIRNIFRRYMANNPDKWDWENAHVPSPLTEEMEEEQRKKIKEKKKKEKERKKKAVANKKEKVHEESDHNPKSVGNEAAVKVTASRSITKSSTPDTLLGVSPEMRMRIERERRARAAETRLRSTAISSSDSSKVTVKENQKDSSVCAMCGTSLLGLVPFEIMQFRFCSTICVGRHRDISG